MLPEVREHMPDGYVDCGCRDCFQGPIMATGSEPRPLCDECVDAGCDPDRECQAPHAYDGRCGDPACCEEG